MFQKILKRIVIGLLLAAALFASAGCDEVTNAAADTQRTVGDGPQTRSGSAFWLNDFDEYIGTNDGCYIGCG